MPADEPLTDVKQKDAALLCDVHEDTVKRWRKAGLLPNSHKRDGVWHIAVSDLVACGHLTREAAADAGSILGVRRDEQQSTKLRIEFDKLAADAQRLQALNDELRDHNRFLRKTLDNVMRAGGGGTQ